MTITNLLMLLGGLGLFLYGMQMMGSGLEAAAGNRMKRILERLTSNPILGVLVGGVITAVIQSSSATTVMVVGFVNSGMMTLRQAVGVIMGANIGTTITGQLIALDVGAIAPLFAFIGVVLVVFIKKQSVRYCGQIIAGLGILFIGMDMMSAAMSPLRESEAFVGIMSNFSNPVLGILAGMIFTAIIQSSSASVGILQALANSGVIAYANSVFVLFGQNIGTCITAVLASIGTTRNAKRTTIIHLMFNIIGTVIFTALFILFPIASVIDGSLVLPGALGSFLSGVLPATPAGQIAITHTSFNIITTLLLLPLGNYLAKAAVKILPDRPEDKDERMHLEYLTPIQTGSKESGLGVSAIQVDQLQHELRRMMLMAQENVEASFRSVLDRNEDELSQVEETEEYIDFLNREISLHISHVIAYETNQQASAVVSSFLTISGNIERIGDHADNLAGYTRMLNRRDIAFSQTAQQEIVSMQDICLKGIQQLLSDQAGSVEWLTQVSALEQRIDDMTRDYRRSHLARMQSGECSAEGGILYSELLTDFERIGDHILNIAQELSKVHQHI